MLLVGSFVLPLLPVIAAPTTASSHIPIFKIGEIGDKMGNWDGVAATAGIASIYGDTALEPLMMQPENWDGDPATMIPCLATQMDIINWPEDTNGLGWYMSGGVKALEFTLRSGVTFHDGSAFNATVAKWNIDRNMVISGNLTGELTVDMIFSDFYKALYSWWLPAYDWAPYETTAWNVSQFIGQPASYAEYGSTKSDVWKWDPWNSWQYWMFDSVYPRIKNVTILDNAASGGKIRVNYNDWSGVFLYVDDHTMISMDAYAGDYSDTPIYGAGDVPGFLQPDVTGGYPATGFPGHLIGTGPYRFIQHNEMLQQGTMVRYDDYWNSTALQPYGGHEVPELAIITFPESDLGFSQQSTAMVTGTIDYAGDGGQLVYGDMIADPDINYIEVGVGADRNFITLNGINETYWETWDATNANTTAMIGSDYSHLYDIDDVTKQVTVDGINRAMRKAVSYAFDYDTYITTIEAGRAVRSGGFLGINNEFYNPSIPLAYRDLTIARQALIDDPSWNAILTARGLDITNSTAQWRAVAATNPVFEFKLLWDLATYDLASLFGNNIKDLGMVLGGLNGAPDGNLLVQPSVYEVLYSDDLVTVPWFTTHGVTTSWPGIDYKMIPVLEYYVASPGAPGPWAVFPDAALTNLGFHYNDTIDEYIKRGWFANRTTLQELYDNMTRHFQTYQYSDIMISHSKYGIALDKNWEYTPLLGYEFVKYVGTTDGGPPPTPIPGFETAIILAIAVVTITGIGYSVKRKRKLP
jgi:ABC-type transport system substrate-binding protein